MIGAFVLITVDIGKEEIVLKYLRRLPYVREAHVVNGVYDVVAKLYAESGGELKKHMVDIREWSKIHHENIRATLTSIIV